MSPLIFERTKKTPHVHLDIDIPLFEIKGSSFSEMSVEIYNPVIEWVGQNLSALDKELVCELHFDILNSISHKKIFQTILALNEFVKKGKKIKIKWLYDSNDEDIEEMGEDLLDLIDMPFELEAIEFDEDEDDDESWKDGIF